MLPARRLLRRAWTNGGQIAFLGEHLDRVVMYRPIAGLPAAAVNAHHDREQAFSSGWPADIETQFLIAAHAKNDVSFDGTELRADRSQAANLRTPDQ